MDAVRIAVGKKVFRSKCVLSFQFGTKDPYIQFSFEEKGNIREHCVYLGQDELKEVKYHIANEGDAEDNDDMDDSMTVIAFRITPTDKNNFTKYTSAYNQEDNDDSKNTERRYISVEVRDTDEFRVRNVPWEIFVLNRNTYLFCSNCTSLSRQC